MTNKDTQEIDFISFAIRSLAFIRRYFILLMIFVILGISYGTYKTCRSRPYYHHRITLRSEQAPNMILIDIVNSLQMYIGEKDMAGFASKTGISTEQAGKIMMMKADTISLTSSICFKIDMEFSDSSGYKLTQRQLIAYLNRIARQQYGMIAIEQEVQISTGDKGVSDTLIRDSIIIRSVAGCSDKPQVIPFGCPGAATVQTPENSCCSPVSIIDQFMVQIQPPQSYVRAGVIYGFAGLVCGLMLAFFLWLNRKSSEAKLKPKD